MHKYELDQIAQLSASALAIQAKAAKEGRGMKADERELWTEIQGKIKDIRMSLPANAPMTLQGPQAYDECGRVVTVDSRAVRGYALRGPTEAKTYRALFGAEDGYKWPDKDTSFFQSVFSGRFDPRLVRAGMTETVPSDGGFLVPTQYAEKIHNVSLENEIIMPRAFVQPMRSHEIKIPAMNIGDHSSNLYGGFTASYTTEAGTISEANPKVRSMELNAKKLTGLIRFSSELAQDIPGGESQIINICGKGLSWYRDKAFLKGSGAGEPLGILNASCLVTVAKETGQVADTIVYENLTKMMSRMFSGSFGKSFWLAHQSTIPQFLTLSVQIGLEGQHIPVMTRNGGGFEILTRPVIFSEKTEKLGDLGDIMLIDASQYVVGLRSEMRFDMSIHVHFSTDELLARLIERHDGQPLWDSALILEDGTTTVSPFVALAERA
jgi:HK97 family phage major capsid protein